MAEQEMSFWEHLEELRHVLLRAIVVLVVLGVACFVAMPTLFDNVILAPCSPHFPLYRFLARWVDVPAHAVELININLTAQFLVHITTSLWLAVVLACPLLLYFCWTFIRSALYPTERKPVAMAFSAGALLFYAGVAVGYWLVFPLTLRFLADYQLSAAIPNQISLDSYMSSFFVVVLMMGLVFELPLLCWLLSMVGVLRRSFFATYRRQAIVALLVLAAVITPSGDPFTLMVVFLPVYALYELSALVVKK